MLLYTAPQQHSHKSFEMGNKYVVYAIINQYTICTSLLGRSSLQNTTVAVGCARKFSDKIAGWHRIDKVAWYSSPRWTSCPTPSRSWERTRPRCAGRRITGNIRPLRAFRMGWTESPFARRALGRQIACLEFGRVQRSASDVAMSSSSAYLQSRTPYCRQRTAVANSNVVHWHRCSEVLIGGFSLSRSQS